MKDDILTPLECEERYFLGLRGTQVSTGIWGIWESWHKYLDVAT